MVNFEEALLDLGRVREMETDHFYDYLLNGYADVYRKMKNFSEAIKFAERSLKSHPSFFYANITLAEIYGELDQDDKFYANLKIGLEAGFNIVDLDDAIKSKYSKRKDYKVLLREMNSKK
jgi:tetratricopeptide (TPR) repeat protein